MAESPLNGTTIFPEIPVMVCVSCGCGFLISPPGSIHPVPAWFTSFSQSGNACGGTIRMANRQQQINNIDRWEQDNAKSQAED